MSTYSAADKKNRTAFSLVSPTIAYDSAIALSTSVGVLFLSGWPGLVLFILVMLVAWTLGDR